MNQSPADRARGGGRGAPSVTSMSMGDEGRIKPKRVVPPALTTSPNCPHDR